MAQKTTNDFWLSTTDLADFVSLSPGDLLHKLEKKFGPLALKSLVSPDKVRQFLASEGYQYPHRTMSFQMLKGGVAKTTTCLNFGLRAAMYGAKVLFVDLDQQANLSFALGVEDESLPVWIDICEKKVQIADAIIKVDQNIDLVPSHLNNSVLDRALMGASRNLAQAVAGPLAEVKSRYDLILIDTSPNLSATNTAVTCASDQIILPINPDKFAILGLHKHLADLAAIREDFALNFEERILFTKFDGREAASREFLTQVAEKFADKLLKHYIRTSSEVKNTIRGPRRHLYQAKSAAKEDYDLVTKEIMGWE